MTSPESGDIHAAPLVSVIINNYNYAPYLRCAVDSALSQTYPHVEVLAVDDGSKDDSREVLKEFQDRIRTHFQDNKGQAAAMNAGFAASRGDIVLFLDADDFLDPDAVSEIVEKFRGGYSKVHVRLRVVNEVGATTGTLPARGRPLATGVTVGEFLKHSRVGCVPTSGNAFQRRALEQFFPLDERFRISADAELLHGAAFEGKAGAIEKELAAYRVHGSNHFAGGAFLAPPDGRFRSRLFGIYSRIRFCMRAVQQDRTLREVLERYGEFGVLADLLIALKFGMLLPQFGEINRHLDANHLWHCFRKALRRERLPLLARARLTLELASITMLPQKLSRGWLSARLALKNLMRKPGYVV
ncbi:MAG TPA: glycosyltransferase [Terrimicrobiaceae bacterium]